MNDEENREGNGERKEEEAEKELHVSWSCRSVGNASAQDSASFGGAWCGWGHADQQVGWKEKQDEKQEETDGGRHASDKNKKMEDQAEKGSHAS